MGLYVLARSLIVRNICIRVLILVSLGLFILSLRLAFKCGTALALSLDPLLLF